MREILPNIIAPELRIVNYFEVIPGSVWGPRQIDDFELIFIEKGVFSYEEDGRCYQVCANQVLCIQPNTEHRLCHVENKGVISCIHFDLLRDVAAHDIDYRPQPCPKILTEPQEPDFIHHLFKQLYCSFHSPRQNEPFIAETLFKCLWAKLSQHWYSEQKLQISQKLEAITQYLKENIKETYDRYECADRFGYTPEHINYLFKKELGMTPTQFITREKILLAYDLLSNHKMAIQDVAEELNFYDRYHFSKAFKKIIGRSPGECVK